MVGNVRPQLDELRASVRSMEVIRWYVENKDAVKDLEDTILRYEAAAERAGVTNDLAKSREDAKRIVSDANAVARETIAEADRRFAQAEEMLKKARDEAAKASGGMDSLKSANAAHAKLAEETKAQEYARKLALDERERKLVIKDNENKIEAERLAALRSRLEAALRG